MQHVTFKNVTATECFAYVEGYDRPLLCSRKSRYPQPLLTESYQERCALWTSPSPYCDPPPSEKPTWTVFAESLRNDWDKPLDPSWCLWAQEPVFASGFETSVFANWIPLSNDPSLRKALAPVVDVIRSRNQPFLSKLRVSDASIAIIQRVYKKEIQKHPERFDYELNKETLAHIHIGETNCPPCQGHGELSIQTLKKSSMWKCQLCGGSGTQPRFVMSIQASHTHHCAPKLNRGLLSGDLSSYFLWEVSLGMDETGTGGLLWFLWKWRRDRGLFEKEVDGEAEYGAGPSMKRISLHGVAARVCGGEYDPAPNVTAIDIQIVVDALEHIARNEENQGPVITEPPAVAGTDSFTFSAQPRVQSAAEKTLEPTPHFKRTDHKRAPKR